MSRIDNLIPREGEGKIIKDVRAWLVSWSLGKGFGFAMADNIPGNVFVHVSEVCEHLREKLNTSTFSFYGRPGNLQKGLTPTIPINIGQVSISYNHTKGKIQSDGKGVKCTKCKPPEGTQNNTAGNQETAPKHATTFTERGKRWFECREDRTTTRMRKEDYQKYLQGEPVELCCDNCGGVSTVKK